MRMTKQPAVELLSPLPLETCCRLLDAQIDPLGRRSGSQPLIGRRDGAWLRVRKRIAYRNSFQTHLTATLSAQGAQTLVRCQFGMHPLIFAFVAVWFTFILSFGGTAVALLYRLATGSGGVAVDELPGVVIPIVMIGGGAGMLWLGRNMARGERDAMLALVGKTLQAKPRT